MWRWPLVCLVVAVVVAVLLAAPGQAPVPAVGRSCRAAGGGPARVALDPSNQAYLVRAHVCDDQFRELWATLLREFPREQLFVLFDDTKGSMQGDFMAQFGDRVILHTETQCKAINPLQESLWKHAEGPLVVGLEALERRYPDFTHAWLVEYDIFCDGSWRRALSRADAIKADLLGPKLGGWLPRNASWMWWDALRGPAVSHVPLKRRKRCFFPLVRFSRAMLEAIRAHVGTGSTGFCEVYVPTLAMACGLTIARLPRSMLGRFTNKVELTGAQLRHGRRNDDRLYHKYKL